MAYAATINHHVISITNLEAIARARLEDARALLAAGRYDGAVYVCGYAVEVALKAKICRILNWQEFPQTSGEFQAYRSFQTHELDVLLRLSGQEPKIKQQHFGLWNVVAVWRPESRYNAIGSVGRTDAEEMINSADQLLEVL
jgi:HEPN domain-containing protein